MAFPASPSSHTASFRPPGWGLACLCWPTMRSRALVGLQPPRGPVYGALDRARGRTEPGKTRTRGDQSQGKSEPGSARQEMTQKLVSNGKRIRKGGQRGDCAAGKADNFLGVKLQPEHGLEFQRMAQLLLVLLLQNQPCYWLFSGFRRKR